MSDVTDLAYQDYLLIFRESVHQINQPNQLN